MSCFFWNIFKEWFTDQFLEMNICIFKGRLRECLMILTDLCLHVIYLLKIPRRLQLANYIKEGQTIHSDVQGPSECCSAHLFQCMSYRPHGAPTSQTHCHPLVRHLLTPLPSLCSCSSFMEGPVGFSWPDKCNSIWIIKYYLAMCFSHSPRDYFSKPTF